jgi:hypothetical protein
MKISISRLTILLGLSIFLGVIGVVSAHEGREVGEYVIEIGWRIEPAYTGLMNGPEVTITQHGSEDEAEHTEPEATTEPEGEHTDVEAEEESSGVEGLDETLQIEVIFGPASRTLNLHPVFNEPGHYTADLIPMLPGDYIFRVFGTIEGFEVDETFSASDGQFSSVEPIEDIQFP